MDLLFYSSLILCGFVLIVFNRALISGIGVNYQTTPFLFFSTIFFLVAPFVNVFFDVYIQKSLLSNNPVWDMTLLNIANIIGLIFGLIGVKFAKPSVFEGEGKLNINHANNFIRKGRILIPICILYGVYFNYSTIEFSVIDVEKNKSIIYYLLIESVPLLFCWVIATYYHLNNKRPAVYIGLLIIIVHLILVIVLNSSRGSRVAMLLQLIIAQQIFMNTVFKYKPIHYLIGCLVLYVLLPIYAYYKYAGLDGFNNYLKYGTKAEVVQNYNDPLKFIIGDIGRADIQAPILRGILEDKIEPRYWPETYIAGLLLIVPNSIRPTFASPKTEVGALAQINLDPASPLYQNPKGDTISTRIYSFLGEGLLNFGLISVPVLFFLFGYISRKSFFRVRNKNWPTNLTNPYFSLLPIFLLFYDFDNIVFQSIVVWGVPVVYLKYLSNITFKIK